MGNSRRFVVRVATGAVFAITAFARSASASNDQPADGHMHVADPAKDPHVTLDLGMGGARYGEALGEDWGIGRAYRVRVGLQLDPVLGFDVGYFGAKHSASVGMTALATSFDVSMRLSLPLPVVRPFITAGMGTARVTLHDDLANLYRAVPRFGFEVPLAAGVEIKLSPELGFQIVGNQVLVFAGGVSDPRIGRTHLMGLTGGFRIYF
jgi:hypothetical protein